MEKIWTAFSFSASGCTLHMLRMRSPKWHLQLKAGFTKNSGDGGSWVEEKTLTSSRSTLLDQLSFAASYLRQRKRVAWMRELAALRSSLAPPGASSATAAAAYHSRPPPRSSSRRLSRPNFNIYHQSRRCCDITFMHRLRGIHIHNVVFMNLPACVAHWFSKNRPLFDLSTLSSISKCLSLWVN